MLAKSLSTLDVLSDGRLDIGVGVGWQREEYEAAGLDFGERGRLLDECLELCTTVWRETPATLNVAGSVIERLHQMPAPIQEGGVPIWISGRTTGRVARRLARFGTGWIPWGDDALDLATSIPRMRQLVVEAGGDPTGLRVVGNLPPANALDGDVDAVMTAAESSIASGATDLVARIPVPDRAAVDDVYGAWAEAFARSVGRR